MCGHVNRSDLRIPSMRKLLVRSRLEYRHENRVAALESIFLILARGNGVRMRNVAGVYFVDELVVELVMV